MGFYYVKSGGTATGDGGYSATKRTGAFGATSTYYDGVEDVFSTPTTTIGGGDHVCVANDSTYSATAFNYAGTVGGEPIYVYSVDVSNQENYAAGASETTSGSSDFTWTGTLIIDGVDMQAGDDFIIPQAADITVRSCTITSPASSDGVFSSGDGQSIEWIDVTWDHGGTNNALYIRQGAIFKWSGGSITSATTPTRVFGGDSILSTSAGVTAEVNGVDLSAVTGAGSYWVGDIGADSNNDDLVNIVFRGCQASASLAGFVEETFTKSCHFVGVYNCGTTSANAEHQFYEKRKQGEAVDSPDSSIHRSESTAFPGGTKVSIKASTVASVTSDHPYYFDLPTQYMDLATVSTDTIRLYFAVVNSVTLTDMNFWAEVIYPDKTNNHTYNFASNRITDHFGGTGTEHTDDSASSTWLDGATDLSSTYNEYRMDVALDGTDGAAGADSAPYIRVYVGEPSIDVYTCTTVDPVA